MAAEQRPVSLTEKLIGTGLGSGYSPVAPGTAGSLVGAGVYMTARFSGLPGLEGPGWGGVIALVFGLGVFVSGRIAREGNPDPPSVVIDEIVGMWIALFMLPLNLWVVTGAFVLFRILDIVKPYPARQSEQLPGGWGIMTDDLVAGIYTNIIIRILLFFLIPTV